MKNTKKWALLFVFFLCIGLPGLPIWGRGDVSGENRRATDRPTLQWDTIDSYPAAYEAYYNDTFPLRGALLDVYGDIKWLAGDATSHNTIHGKEGWIFYDATLADYKNYQVWGEEEQAVVKAYVGYLQELAAEFNANLYLFLGPNKNEIYPEFMPERIRRNWTNDAFAKLERLLEDTGVQYIPVAGTLHDKKQEYSELYYPQGSHWNTIGGYYAYYEVFTRIQQDFPTLRVLQPEQVEQRPSLLYTGPEPTLRQQRTWDDISATVAYDWAPPKGWYETQPPAGEFIIQTSDAGNGLKIVVYHDSFYNALLYFSAGSADRLASCSSAIPTREALAQEQPDIIIVEIVQRDLYARAVQYQRQSEENAL